MKQVFFHMQFLFPFHGTTSTNSDSTAVDSLTGLDLLTVSWLGGLGLVDLAWWTWLGGLGLVDLAWWIWLGGLGLVDLAWRIWLGGLLTG